MKKYCCILGMLSLSLVHFSVEAQYIFESNPGGGPWTSASTWSCISDDLTGEPTACDGAPLFPGALDIAVISSNSATPINLPLNITVGDVYFMSNAAANKLGKGSPLVAGNLTINGQLVGISPDLSTLEEPVNAVIANATNLTLIFNGSNGNNPVIASWGHNAPLPKTTFSPTGTIQVESFSIRQASVIQSGTVQIASGHELRDFTGTSTLTVNSGAILQVDGSIGRGTNPALATNRFGTITVNGTVNTAADSYINAATFTMSSSGILNIGFNGANQTQGWWYQTNSPSGGSLNAGSIANYNANAVQTIAAVTYGNLVLTTGSTPVVKTLSGSGLGITGNLVVGANVTFSPASQVDFTGTAAQAISGTGTLNFNGGFEVNKASGTLTLAKNLTLPADIFITLGTLNLGDVTTTLSSGADVSNTGSVTSGNSGTLIVAGSGTSFSGSGAVALNNLTISSNTSINNNAWSLSGNLVNNGTLTLSSTSTVTFTGGATQTISGNAFSVGNMTLNKPSSILYNEGTVELRGALTVTTGTFEADGLPDGTGGSGVFTLNSDTNGDARIGVMAGGSVKGNITFERYFDNTSNRWRNLAFPVTSVTHTALQTSFPIHTNSLSYYQESTPGDVSLGWQYVNSGTLLSTRGYSAWMYNIAPITISVRGPLLKDTPATSVSPYNFGVTYNNTVVGAPDAHDGWNFIPNPFASAIDWDNAGWVKTNVNAAAAIWDIEANIYRYTGAGWDGVIAAGQAFWVQTNAATPILTCQESVKVSDTDPVFYRVAAPEDKLLVKLKSTEYEDIAAIWFREDATAGFDTQYDASKLTNPIFNLSSVTREGLSLAVNNLPKGPCASKVFLNITNIQPGSYTLKFEGLDSFKDLESVILLDHFTNTTTTLTDKSSHAFEVSSDKDSFGSSRFELSFNFPQADVAPLTISREDGVLLSSYQDGTHKWFLNDVLIEQATEASYQPTANGNYVVEASYKGCAMRSESITVEGMSRVYPNPVSGDLQIHVADLVPDGVTSGEIVIISTLGSTVKQVSFSKGDLIKTIDMRDVRPGQYIVSISNRTKIFERVKLVVQ